jgi:dihydroorotase-like cyclic amidohydrolase
LATNTGWAYGAIADDRPIFGTERFSSGRDGARGEVFANALRWMLALCKSDNRPDAIVCEAPLHHALRQGKSREGNDEIAFGLAAVIQAAARVRGVRIMKPAKTISVRAHFINANLKREEAKRATIRRCHTLGIPVADDNQADAVALWFYQSGHLRADLALRTTPLWSGAPMQAEDLEL